MSAGIPSGDTLAPRRFGWVLAVVLPALAFLAIFAFLVTRRREGERLVFACWGTVEEKLAYEALVEEYNRTGPEVPVVFNHVSWPYYEKVMVQTVGNNAPDVFKLDTSRVVDWARRNAIRDLTPLVREDKDFSLDRFFPQLLPDDHYGGRLYAVPIVFSPFVLYYNKDLFDKAGLEYPDASWDWDKFLEVSGKLTLRNARGEAEQFGCAMDIGQYFYPWQAGGRFYDERRERCIFDSPETVRGLAFYADLIHRHRVMPGVAESRTQDSQTRFATGRVAMITTGRWGVPWFSKSKDMRWGVAMMPKGPAGRVTGLCSHSIAISAYSRRPRAAWEFVKFLVGEKSQLAHARDGNNIPALRSVAESAAFLGDKATFPNSDNRVFVESLPFTYPWWLPPSPGVSLGVVERIGGEEMGLLVQEMQTPAQTAAAIQRRVNEAIAEEAESQRSRTFAGSAAFWGLLLAGAGAAFLAGRAVVQKRRS